MKFITNLRENSLVKVNSLDHHYNTTIYTALTGMSLGNNQLLHSQCYYDDYTITQGQPFKKY